jgi:hypothetical protein
MWMWRHVMPIATATATAIASAPPITASGIQRGITSGGESPGAPVPGPAEPARA